jgi:hypothetical protein
MPLRKIANYNLRPSTVKSETHRMHGGTGGGIGGGIGGPKDPWEVRTTNRVKMQLRNIGLCNSVLQFTITLINDHS